MDEDYSFPKLEGKNPRRKNEGRGFLSYVSLALLAAATVFFAYRCGVSYDRGYNAGLRDCLSHEETTSFPTPELLGDVRSPPPSRLEDKTQRRSRRSHYVSSVTPTPKPEPGLISKPTTGLEKEQEIVDRVNRYRRDETPTPPPTYSSGRTRGGDTSGKTGIHGDDNCCPHEQDKRVPDP